MKVSLKVLDNSPTVAVSRSNGNLFQISSTVSAYQFLHVLAQAKSKEERKLYWELIEASKRLYGESEMRMTWIFDVERSQDRVLMTAKCDFLRALKEVDPHFSLKLWITQYDRSSMSSRVSEVVLAQEGPSGQDENEDLKLKGELGETLWYNCQMNATTTSSLVVAARAPDSAFKKMMEEHLFSDTIVTSKSGSQFPCHKSILAAHSEPFKAMLQGDFIEAKTSVIKMEEMDDDGIKAFLAYLYCKDLKAPNDSAQIAAQLFKAGQTYLIDSLLGDVKDILLHKPVYWFELDDVLEMFVTAQGINGTGDPALLEQLMRILKLKQNAAGAGGGIIESDCFKELFRTSPDVALKLCESLCKY